MKDAADATIGKLTKYLLVDSAFKCDAIERAADAVNISDSNRRDSILSNVHLAEVAKRSSYDLANAGKISEACTNFKMAQNLLKDC